MKRLFKCIILIYPEQMALELKSDSSAFKQIAQKCLQNP